ncbi:hypothetical protein TRIATDRAFT_88516 [Trichoderma atroviride IMI 206040]|uniref:Nephrocystin 3-like N-terminal domain-containing protein n=1 Tax=Hypocrea atroviridis (strain ATCC 20476 / IMI 206040) TaxID=452589 RepID=G9NTS1_HYPAI|nr:uncharacterized protein TRIATDRAFT_88516 [Trichoderma atroviride IMI 206040]EHK46109.1 hypothetical protein TRIATDRAFT_88516 [Trichoderma atroviride IMI 206040]
MFKNFANKGKKKNRNADPMTNDSASINSAASGSTPSQTVITPTVLRRSATMEPNKSRGLVVSYTPPDPVVSTTPGPSDNTAIISQVSSSQNDNSHNEVITKAVNRVITSTTTISKSTEVVESKPSKMQTMFTKTRSRSKVSPKPEVTHITLDYYLEYISNERLRRMPGRGSAWDRVLHAAQFFGLHISDFGDKINTFINGELLDALSQEARVDDISGGQEVLSNGRNDHASINGALDLITSALTTAHSLLEIGYTQAETLLPTFSALYEISVLYTDIIRAYNLQQPSHEILNALVQTFHSVIVFLNGMRTLYQQKISNVNPGSSESLNFGPNFKSKVEQVWRFKEALSNEIWKQKLEAAGLPTNVNLLQSKLQLNKSHYVPNGVFEKIGHYANISTEVGYWLKNILSDDNSGQIVCITGDEACGKTFLAGWIEERLARPIHVESNHVLRYDFPYNPPSLPTADVFLKNILYKILEENVGNIDVYKSIAHAFERQSGDADSGPTELLLWEALQASLKAIRIQHASIIMILDSCEGIAGGDAEFYKKLRTCIHELSNVRVVTFSRSIPDSVREYEHEIPNTKVEKDIETYFLEILSRSDVFNSLSSTERKEFFQNIMAKANNNWLWSFYASKFLSKEQSKASLLQSGHDMETDILLKVMKTFEFDKRHSLRNHSLKTLLTAILSETKVQHVFPGSITLLLLERTCWSRAYTKEQLVLNHKLALQIRQACFGEHVTVVHTLISLGYTYLNVLGSHSDAAWYFYKAAKLGEKILTAKSAIVHSCTSHFLKYMATLKITGKTEITTVHTQEKIDIVECYAEMIQLAIRIDQHKHGYSSDQVIFWYKTLTKLYIDSKQEERVIDVYKELYTATATKYGSESEEAKRVYRYFVTLDIVFNDPSVGRVGELEQLIFGIGKEFTDYLCIKNWLWLANTFEQCKHLFEAERLYVSLWQSITVICDREADVDASSIKIDIALEYVKFLRRQGRDKDASSILICLAAEYKEGKECHEYTTNGETEESEAVIKYITRIRDVAEECRAIGLTTIAVSILRKVWNSFSSKGYSKETQRTATLITEVIKEITETTTTVVTTKTTTVTESTEKAVKELFEHFVHQHHHDESDTTLFSASKALISVYTQQQNWREAEETLKKTLNSTWREILIAGSKIKLPQYSIGECLDIAHHLADCYSTQGLFSMAEEIHSQIFAACSTLELEDNLSTKSTTLTGAELYEAAANSLVAFYEGHHRHTEAINVHIKVLEKYEKELGTKHESTIKTLYLLADRYMTLGHEEAYIYYEKIVNVLNEGLDYCHHQALRAALVLSKHYDARSFWDKLHAICNVLWVTITQHHEEHVVEGAYKIDAEAIASVYDRYSYVLDHHAKAEFSERYDIAVKYRDMITKTSDDEALVVKTLIALAKICETHKDYYKVSVSAYEDVLKRTTTNTEVTTVTTVETVKKLLSRMYVTMVEESQTTEFESERAIAVTLETYHKHKDEFKTNPDQALVYLKNVILLYQKLNASERIYQFLEEAIRHILAVATVNIELFHVAHEFATLLATTGLTQNGRELLHKMRKSITHGHKHSHNDAQIDHESQMKKVVFIFLIVFAHGLEQPHEKLSYSKVMTENVLEFLLLEKYSQKVKEEAKSEVILEYGAKLRHFWHFHHRHEFVKDLDEELLKRFKATFSQYFVANIRDEIIKFFYTYLMEELGEDRPSLNFDFETFMLQIGNELVKDLLGKDEFDDANQISFFIFSFAKEKKLYYHASYVRYGCMLAQYLVGIDASHPDDAVHSKALLKTSLDIMTIVIDAINTLDIAFETLPSEDLIGLVHLLYRQSNYKQLERVLSPLWNMRSDLSTVSDSELPTIAEIGTCLVHAQCAQNRWSAAIETVRELYYNLQRGLGRLHPETLAVSQLFSNVLVTNALGGDTSYASYAMDLHEAVLTEICRHSEIVYNGYTRRDIQLLSKTAELHLELLKRLHSQFQDSELEHMSKREKVFHGLSAKLTADFTFDGMTGELPWQYTLPTAWKFGELEEEWNGVDTLETSKREWVLASRIFY